MAQPVWNRTTISPSSTLNTWCRTGKAPQPGQAPCPGAIRLGTSAIAHRGFSSTSSLPVSSFGVTLAMPRLTSSVWMGGKPSANFSSGAAGKGPVVSECLLEFPGLSRFDGEVEERLRIVIVKILAAQPINTGCDPGLVFGVDLDRGTYFQRQVAAVRTVGIGTVAHDDGLDVFQCFSDQVAREWAQHVERDHADFLAFRRAACQQRPWRFQPRSSATPQRPSASSIR